MTAVLTRPESESQWGSMPSWSVVADLTPPELINLRWIAVLRRRILFGLVAIAVLCAAGYAYAVSQHSVASDSALSATGQTTQLQGAEAKYAGIVQIQNDVTAINGQVATALADDVDVAHLTGAMRAALPNTMSIQNLTVTLTPAVTGATGTPTGLDASGHAEIGTVTISGSGRALVDLPTFVDRLTAIPGVVNVVPGSNQVDAGLASFTVTASLTDQLYSHRYSATKTGGK